MSDVSTAGAQVAPVTDTSAQVTQPAPKAAPAPSAPAPSQASDPAWLQARLARERAAVLKELGIKVDKKTDASQVIEQAKQKYESRKSERKELRAKVAEYESKLAELSSRASTYEETIKAHASAEMASLSDADRKAIQQIAGESHHEALRQIAAFRLAGKLGSIPNVSTAPAPIAAPAQTTPAQSAPAPTAAQPVDVKAEYARLAAVNPYLARQFALENRDALLPRR